MFPIASLVQLRTSSKLCAAWVEAQPEEIEQSGLVVSLLLLSLSGRGRTFRIANVELAIAKQLCVPELSRKFDCEGKYRFVSDPAGDLLDGELTTSKGSGLMKCGKLAEEIKDKVSPKESRCALIEQLLAEVAIPVAVEPVSL